jgi:hypothetical protein
MKAADELRLLQEKLSDGSLPPEEPVFVLRGRDTIAAKVVRIWAVLARTDGSPPRKIAEAEALAKEMDAWPIKQIAGRPDTRNARKNTKRTDACDDPDEQ